MFATVFWIIVCVILSLILLGIIAIVAGVIFKAIGDTVDGRPPVLVRWFVYIFVGIPLFIFHCFLLYAGAQKAIMGILEGSYGLGIFTLLLLGGGSAFIAWTFYDAYKNDKEFAKKNNSRKQGK
ncbi:MAG: hypothetical protein LBF71_04905 [Campylobacteraceae bacterium]|jgi:ABC-type arginine/histidine transport system permease subunit|nr:hypothetical protein [Campylobacteraceae bacterium]